MENIIIKSNTNLDYINKLLKDDRQLSCVGKNSNGFIFHFEDAPGKYKLWDIELDLIHRCLTELYESDIARPKIKKLLDKLDIIKRDVP